MSGEPPVLLTFAPMVDSELSRLVLAHHGVAYQERDHLFGWVSLLTIFRGGYGRIPLLHGGGFRATGPLKIAARLDEAAPAERRLVPASGPLAAQVAADVDAHNGSLAIAVARFAYFHLLPQRELMTAVFQAPVPPREARILPYVYRPTRLLFRLLLLLDPERVAQARARIVETFAELDWRLADGRDYLDGDRLTLADLALMASAAPILLPDGYGAVMPPPKRLPSPLSALREELIGSATAAWVQRRYNALQRP
jgi:glutathione S-transferase